MNTQELIATLRATADRLESAQPHGTRASIKIYVHGTGTTNITSRDDLASWARTIESPEARAYHGGCWIEGRIGAAEVTAFYEPGMLGETVIVEQGADLNSLLETPA